MGLLEKRVKEFSIPEWPGQAVYDRIIVYKLPEEKADRETFQKGGVIVKPEHVRSAERASSPRGIIVSAGLGAMDIMRGHGIDLGHVVWLARFAAWRHVVERTEKGDIEFWFMRVGDIVNSEDLLASLQKKKVKIELRDGKHQLTIDDDLIPRFEPPAFSDDI